MGVFVSDDELKKFQNNGISEDDIKDTITQYRNEGVSDDDIRSKIDVKLNSFNPPKQNSFVESLNGGINAPFAPTMQNKPLNEVNENSPNPVTQVVSSIPEAAKQFGTRAVKSFPQFGVGVNDLVSLVGDKTGLQGLSDFGRSNAQFWQEQSDKIQINPKYQGVKGLSSPETFLPTVAGSIGDQATNLITAMGGGAGGAGAAARLGLNGLAKTGLIAAGTSIPNVAQEGPYLDKIQQFQELNGRLPNEQEIKQIQNVALGEKGVNTVLETVADKFLFGKLFPNGITSKGIKQIAKSAGEQAATEAITEGLQEGVSIGAEKALGINQGNNLQRLADSMAIGGITGGVTGGGATAISQPLNTQLPQQASEALKNVSAQIVNNGKILYNSASDALNNAGQAINNQINAPTAFDSLRQLSQMPIEEIAPQTVAKQNAQKWNIENLPHLTKEEAESTNVKLYKKLAPKTIEKQENNYAEENAPVQLDEEDTMLQNIGNKQEEILNTPEKPESSIDELKGVQPSEQVPQLKPEETQDDFKQRIWGTPIEKYKPTKYTIDWGKQKQQGKRSNGMVTGSMGDISLQGKKEYSNILGAFPEDIQKDVRSYVGGDDIQQMAYVKARENGFSHDQSIDFAITFGDKENLLYKKLSNKPQEATIYKTENVEPTTEKISEVEKERRELKRIAYSILAQASGKDVRYVRMTFNNKGKSKAAKVRAEKLESLLLEPDDKISVDPSVLRGYEGYFGYSNTEDNDYNIVKRAMQIVNDRFEPTLEDKLNIRLNEEGEYLQQRFNEGNNIKKSLLYNIDNSKDIDELDNNFEQYQELEKYEDVLEEKTFYDVVTAYRNKLGELENEYARIQKENNRDNQTEQSTTRRTEENAILGSRGTIQDNRTEAPRENQIAIEGLGKDSAKSIEKQQAEITSNQSKDITKTKEFKKWFGDSKVVDEEGKPLVVYHGSPSPDIEIFDSNKSLYGDISEGFNFFTNKKSAYQNSAKDYAEFAGTDGYRRNGKVYETYLKIENPLHIKYTSNGMSIYNGEKLYATPVEYYDNNYKQIKEEYNNGDYDGIIIENTDKNNDDSIIYLVPNSNQIKSVDNQGTFDSNNPNIYKSIDIPSFMNNYTRAKGYKDIDLQKINDLISNGCSQDKLLSALPSDLYEGFRNIQDYKFYNLKTSKKSNIKGMQLGGETKSIGINLDKVGNNPRKLINTLMHEVEHADQEEYYNYLRSKQAEGIKLTKDEADYMRAYRKSNRLNKVIQRYINRNKSLIENTINPFLKKFQNVTREELVKKIDALPSKLKRDIIYKHLKYMDAYRDMFKEVGARASGRKYSEGYIDEERTIIRRKAKASRSIFRNGTDRNIGAKIRNGLGRGNLSLEEPTNGRKIDQSVRKERGAVETISKFDKEMSDAITDREYEVRGFNKISEDIKNMSEEELQKILEDENISDIKTVALAQSIKKDVAAGNVPVSKLNKWAVEGTKIGQSMQSRTAIAPETVEEAVIEMYSNNTKNAPKQAKELLKDAGSIVKKIKQEIKDNKFKEEVDEFTRIGNALRRDKERKRKVVERLITERIFGIHRKKRADLIDNIIKLDENDGLTEDNFCKLINKMYKIKEVTPADIKELKKLENNIKTAKTQREEDVAKAFMQKYVIDNSIGSSAWEKIDALRYINMLGGTAQRVLDFASTGVYQLVRVGDESVVMVLDKAASKLFGTDRVTSGYYPLEWGKGIVQGTKEGIYDVSHGINTGRAGETARYDLNKPVSFKYRPLKTQKGFIKKALQSGENTMSVLEKLVNGMVKVPDRAFFNAKYNTSLLSQLKARGIKIETNKYSGSDLSEYLTNNATPEEIEQAVTEARENVYQRDCVASQFARNIRNGLNSLPGLKIGDWAFPFIHTTSVISQDIVERLGVGLIKGTIQLGKIKKNGGTKGQLRDAYNSIAKGIIGASIIMLGALNKDDNDKDYKDREITGEHENSVKVGNISLNAKDIPSLLIPYKLGQMLAASGGDEEKIYKTIKNVFTATASVNPILSKYIEITKSSFDNNNDKDKVLNWIADTLSVPVAQLTQNAQLRNIRTITDPYERETYDVNSKTNTYVNRFKNATPGLSNTLPKKYNAIGEPIKRTNIDNSVERALSALVTSHKRVKPDNEVYDTYKFLGENYKNSDITGKTNLYMTKIKRGIKVNGQNYKMTNAEFSDFQRDYGKINYGLRAEMLKNNSNLDINQFTKDLSERRASAEEAVKIIQLGHEPSTYKNGRLRLHKYTEFILRHYDELTKGE